MSTQTLTRCYRYSLVDFEPDLNLLVWHDHSETLLTQCESNLLDLLCHHAGQVLSFDVLGSVLITKFEPYEDKSLQPANLYDLLTSLRQKLHHHHQSAIPIESIQPFGFRVPLPNTTCRQFHRSSDAPVTHNDLSAEKRPLIPETLSSHQAIILTLTLIALFLFALTQI